VTLLLTVFVTVISAPLYAFEIKNLKAWEKGGYIHVQYDLIGTELGESEADVAVVLEIGDKKYASNKISISGDFGSKTKVGRAKKFKWQVAKDFPSGFTGDIAWDVTALSAADRLSENELIKEKERLKMDLTGEWRQVVLISGVPKPGNSTTSQLYPGIKRIEQKNSNIRAYMNYNNEFDVNFFKGIKKGNLITGEYNYDDTGNWYQNETSCRDLGKVTATLDDSGSEIRFKYNQYCRYWSKSGLFFGESGFVKSPTGSDIEVIYRRYFDEDHIGPEGLKNKIYGK
jgi:hypothetical protein